MNVTLPVIGTAESYTLRPSKIIGIGLNYRAHIAESESVKLRGMDGDGPDEPVLFMKSPNALIGPNRPIPIPAVLSDYPWAAEARTDYEGELVVIIGAPGKHIPEERALEHVYGCTCGVDVSQRNIQNSDRSGWFRGKSFDGFAPVGPAVLRAEDAGELQSMALSTRLNGKTVQSSNTRMMIFTIPRLIAHISRQFTLNEDDLIFTGTPEGVGPLHPGDTLEVEIQGIGVLTSPVEKERIRTRNSEPALQG